MTKKLRLGVVLLFLLGMALVPSFTSKADASCFTCETVFNSQFCFPSYPGRSGCSQGDGRCYLNGAFCDIIIVVG